MNSDMSILIRASSVSNRKRASVLQSSVLPTPVGPRKRNEPLGRAGSERPARARRIALETAFTASFWPITCLCSSASSASSLARSASIIFATGMPVHLETTSAISSSVTRLRSSVISDLSALPAASSCFSRSGIRPYWSSDIRVRSPARRAASRSSRNCSSSSLIC